MESCRILVLYDSEKGSTRRMAEAVAEGAAEVRHTVVETRPVREVKLKELLEADAFAFGTPNHYGTMSAPMKMFFRRLKPLWKEGSLRGKPACVFTVSGKYHGGAETALLTLMVPLFAHGLILVGLPPFPRKYITEGCFLGARGQVDHEKGTGPSEEELRSGRLLGERLARTAIALKTGRSAVKEEIAQERREVRKGLESKPASLEEVERLIADGDVEAWQCTNCGYIHEGERPPEQCPVCNMGMEYFTAYDVDAWECTSCGYVVYSERPKEECPVCGAAPDAFMPYSG